MGEFIKDRLPDPETYFESEGLVLVGKGKGTAGHHLGYQRDKQCLQDFSTVMRLGKRS